MAGKSICSRTVWAFVIASAMTISAGCIALKNSVSSSTLLTIIFGDKPADSNKRRRLVDCEAKTIVGIVNQTFLHQM